MAPFYVMEMMAAAEHRIAAGLPIHNLAAGQPSTPAPEPVIEAARRALAGDRIGYTAAPGIAPLREAIAGHVQRWYGVDVSPTNIVVTTGSSGGFLLSFLAAFDAGDVVAMARPGYPAYRNILASLDCVVQEFDCGAEHDYVPTIEMLDTLDPLPKGLVIASPANPTGAMLPDGRLEEIVRWCERNGIRLISDEIYHGISYGHRGASAWEYGRSAITINSFSKYFSMTGWRLGWLLVPDELVEAVDTLAGNYAICPPTLSQLAGIAAFDAYDELDANVERYAANRALMLGALPALGLDKCAPADGAFYVYSDVSHLTTNSLAWVRQVIADCGVALTPGIDFDTARGNQFIRMSFAGAREGIEQALDVLGTYLSTR